MYYMLEDPIATMLGDWSSELGAGAIIFRIIISIIFPPKRFFLFRNIHAIKLLIYEFPL